MPTGTHTNDWLNNLLDDDDVGSEIDDKMDQLALAVYERMRRGGFFFKDNSNDGRQALPYTSPNAYEADKFIVYGKDGSGEPDTSDPRLEVTESGGTLYGAWDMGTTKRLVTLLASTRDYTGGNVSIGSDALAFPPGVSGTIIRTFARYEEALIANDHTIKFYMNSGGFVSNRAIITPALSTLNFAASNDTEDYEDVSETFDSADGFGITVDIENDAGSAVATDYFHFGVVVELDY